MSGPNLEPILYWMTERHKIWLRRKDGEKRPWTKDPILNEWKFCNVYRMLDRETIWLFDNWYRPYADHDMLAFAACLARQINWSPTLEDIGFPKFWDPRRTYDTMKWRQVHNKKVYTGSYMLPGRYGVDKPWATCYEIMNAVWERRDACLPKAGDTLQTAWYRLKLMPGFGPFLAYEVITDLRHTRYLQDASDIMTWTNPGPGARRGLNRIYGRPLKARPKRTQMIEEMRDLLERLNDALPDWMPALELRDVEHSLCETDKYLRVKEGQGQPRSRYKGVDGKYSLILPKQPWKWDIRT